MPEGQTKTVLRSRSMGKGQGYHEVSFEDRAGFEVFYEKAERDREMLTQSEERSLVGGDRKRRVEGDEHISVGGARREYIQGGLHQFIEGGQFGQVEGGASLTFKGDVKVAIEGRLILQATRSATPRETAGRATTSR